MQRCCARRARAIRTNRACVVRARLPRTFASFTLPLCLWRRGGGFSVARRLCVLWRHLHAMIFMDVDDDDNDDERSGVGWLVSWLTAMRLFAVAVLRDARARRRGPFSTGRCVRRF